MATKKVYGQDGPPQLRQRVENLPVEDVPKFYGEEGLMNWHLSVPEWWGKRMRCTCGAVEAFEVLSGTSKSPGWVGGKPFGHQRCDLHCTRCGDRFLFFDDGLHGWNAVVADERATLPADYVESNAKILAPLACACGGRLFSVVAEVEYDLADSLEGVRESEWDDAYGSFSATARCAACGELHRVIETETA